jgi:hypothetical protein
VSATGYASVDFGAAPGSGRATTVITGQTGILTGSFVEAWLFPLDTADHSVDEHIIDGPKILAASIVAGTGFTIYADAGDRPGSALYGAYSVAWVWT